MQKDTLRPAERPLKLQAQCVNFVGLHRTNNEDAFCINDYWLPLDEVDNNVTCAQEIKSTCGLYGVFDGVGGDPHGEAASCAAAQYFSSQKALLFQSAANEAEVDAIYKAANEFVNQESGGSGTTAVLLVLTGGNAYVSNVGDSSAYLFRRGALEEINQAHNLTGSTATAIPSHAITRYLGGEEEQRYHPFVAPPIPVEHNDVFLLCSDGITDRLPHQQISELLSRPNLTDRQRAEQIVRSAMEAGSRDNATVLLVRVQMT